MKITIKGQRVFCTGKIEGYTEPTLNARLAELGAEVAASANKAVTLALIGARASQKKIDQASALGIMCLQGDEVAAILRDGVVEHVEAQATQSADALFGDLRSLLAQPPSHKRWAALCELVDQCDPTQQDAVIDYLNAQLDREPAVQIADDNPRYDDRAGVFSDAAGSLRYLPSGWLTAALSGDQHPKLKLCRAITFSFTKVNNTAALPIFNNPALSHVEIFDLGSTMSANIKKANFYKAMASAKNLQSVHTLMLSEAPDRALDALLTATSLPALRAIHLRTDTHYMNTPDKGAALFAAGPWAAQLECVGVNHAAHLATLVRDLPALPRLSRVALSTHTRTEPQDFIDMARHLPQIAARIERLDLATTSIDTCAEFDGFGVFLDALAASDLKVLDISLATALSGERGEAFVKAHLLDNGLARRVGQLIVGDRLSPALCALLRDADVAVIADAPATAAAAPEAAAVAVELGELVVAPSGLSVADVTAFEEPCVEAWRVLVSVVEGLERELEPARFEQAVGQLEAHIAAWPDTLRLLPTQWFGALFEDAANPKLRLARGLWIDILGSDEDSKQTSVQIARLATSSHIGHLRWVGMWLDGDQKHALDAVAALFAAIKPAACYFSHKQAKVIESFKARLRAESSLPDAHSVEPHRQERSHSASLDALSLRRAALKVETPEAFAQLIQRQDLEGLIALDLDLWWRDDAVESFDWSAIRAVTARLPALRYLKLRLGRLPPPAAALLATWLKDARPLFVDDPFTGMEPAETPIFELLSAGIYARAFASTITIPPVADAAQLAALGSGAVQVAALRVMYGNLQLPTTRALLSAMHPSLRERLRVLHWPLAPAEHGDAGDLLAQLPSLVCWHPQDDTLAASAGRASLIAALACAQSARRLVKAQLITPGAQTPQKLTSAETKALGSGGLHPAALCQRKIAYPRF